MDFSRTDQLVIDTFGMSEKAALAYLKKNRIEVKRVWWYNKKKDLKQRAREIIYKDAKEFEAKHIERVTTIRNLHNKALDMLDSESDNIIKLKIMEFLSKLQYDLANFEEASRDIIETTKQESVSVPESESITD